MKTKLYAIFALAMLMIIPFAFARANVDDIQITAIDLCCTGNICIANCNENIDPLIIPDETTTTTTIQAHHGGGSSHRTTTTSTTTTTINSQAKFYVNMFYGTGDIFFELALRYYCKMSGKDYPTEAKKYLWNTDTPTRSQEVEAKFTGFYSLSKNVYYPENGRPQSMEQKYIPNNTMIVK